MTAPGQADEYMLTTAQIEVQFVRGSVTKKATINKSQSHEFGNEFLRWLTEHNRAVREAALEEVALKIDAMEEAHRDDDRSYRNGLSDASRIVRRAAANQTGEQKHD